jgi:peptidoglycan/xylan/chitin deacetylase (PgdA/CDA1 family)
MELEEKLGVRSTFFFLKETAKVSILKPSTWSHYARKYDFREVEEIIRKLSSRGWEVGLHGSYHSFKSEDMLKGEKKSLEKVLGKEVKGIRQHHLNLKFPDTWIYQEKAGFEYDTSLGFKGEDKKIGFRWQTCFPFYPFADGRKLSILEIPLAIMDICITPKKDWERCVEIVEEVEKYGGVLTLLWHHTVFNEREYPSWKRFYAELIRLAAEKGAWITSGIEIAKWWKTRDRANISVKIDEEKLKIISDEEVPVMVYPPDDKVEVDSNVEFEIVRMEK